MAGKDLTKLALALQKWDKDGKGGAEPVFKGKDTDGAGNLHRGNARKWVIANKETLAKGYNVKDIDRLWNLPNGEHLTRGMSPETLSHKLGGTTSASARDERHENLNMADEDKAEGVSSDGESASMNRHRSL